VNMLTTQKWKVNVTRKVFSSLFSFDHYHYFLNFVRKLCFVLPNVTFILGRRMYPIFNTGFDWRLIGFSMNARLFTSTIFFVLMKTNSNIIINGVPALLFYHFTFI